MELDSPSFKVRRGLDESSGGVWEDRISKLPNEVLAFIFSFLPTKEVGTTSILSKRWRYAWTYHPILEFDDQFFIKCNRDLDSKLAYFKDSVDHALFCHGGQAIKKCSFHCHTNQVSPNLYGWISAALCCNVKELSIKSFFNTQELPPSLFTCRTLVVLEIEGPFLMNPPFRVCFPSLKTLSLDSVIYGDDSAMQQLFSRCPVLEDLKIVRRLEWDGVLITSISVPTLKTLTIIQNYLDRIQGYKYKMVIDAPNVEYLHLNDGASEVNDVNFSNSLAEADIGGIRGSNVLPGISHVRQLSLSDNALLILNEVLLPVFHNLIHLELGVKGGWNPNFLSNLLSSTPNLKVLVFSEGLLTPSASGSRPGFYSFHWDPPESPPACLQLHLKEIKIHNFVGIPCERFLVRYLLEHCLVLDNMNIYWFDFGPRSRIMKDMTVSYKEIMDYDRGSPTCNVEFFDP